ncbi:ABC transporter substrate-binding protein [Anaerophilus nitritogenes]|uniref:ABC transporter substrate-binding protein n=1 Tax=Anaerophilus nitritogenes TaxID=2498136 RepID=UPI001931018B|nr:ABC transporter substrate-binding protein [Anaerophilus nitritogenes]
MFKSKKSIWISILSLIMIISIAGCSPASKSNSSTATTSEKSKISFTDLSGRKVELDGPAKRIFLGFYAESFIAINGGVDNVVCISKAEWSEFFNAQYKAYEASVPELKNIIDTGSIYKGSFSMETTISLAPDVAILAPFQFETLGENVKKLEEAGTKIVVVDYNAQKVDRHVLSTEIIGMITGKTERAKELSDEYVAAVEDVKNRVAHLNDNEKRRVYIELGNLGAQEYGNSYGDYMWGGLAITAGGNNIAFGKIESYGPLSPEYILSSDPEYIFLAGSIWSNDTGNRVKIGYGVDSKETNNRIEPYTKRPGWNKISAIKNDNIYAVDHAGLRSIYDYVYLQFIAKSMYPDLFKDVNPEENILKFYENYLPIKATGCFMTKYEK